MTLAFAPADLDDPRIRALVAAHNAHSADAEGPEISHALDVEALRAPDLTLFAAFDGATPVGIAALKHLPGDEGEIKSVHIGAAHRGRGLGRALIDFLLVRAKAAGLGRVWLETGSAPRYAASRAVYEAFGFEPCPPFGDYPDHPGSHFMTKAL